MRKLISFNVVTLDGFFEGPNGEFDWPVVDAEFNEFSIEQLKTIDTLFFGRVTYQMMASYWTTSAASADDPLVAEAMNTIPKVVFSRTLETAEWQNSQLIKDNIADEVLKLKQQPGKDMAVFGSANLLAELMRLDLIDEHRIMVNPVILGAGNRLFKDVRERLSLKLVNTRTFRSGNVLLYYQPERKE